MTRARELAKVSTAYETGGAFGHRNKIINGDMRIDQRNAGASLTADNGAFPVDRFRMDCTQSGKGTIQQTPSATETGYATRIAAGFTNYVSFTSSSAYSVTSSDEFTFTQNIEGFNTADLAWGTSSAKPITLSFLVYSSLTGNFGGAIANGGSNRSYPFTYTISSANTWTQVSITIPGDTTGTWLTTNGNGMRVWFSLGCGSTYSGTANAWAAGDYRSVTGSVSVVGTNGAKWNITGVQLEKGSSATGFEYRQYGTELNLCQRYYQKISYDGTGGEVTYGVGAQQGTTYAYIYTPYLQTMRSEPTAAISNLMISNFRSYSVDCTLTSIQAGYSSCSIIYGFSSAGSADAPVYLQNKNNVAGFLSFSAEL